ncbi:MAG: type VI secretion system baseplate subunit TssE [Acidobacteriota bacterium]
MAHSATESMVTQSVLDRLMTVEDWPQNRAQSIRYFKDALRRDLEWLLNTRRSPIPEVESYPGIKGTIIDYGLPDISSLGLSSAADHRLLRLAMEACVRAYEPRLMNARVTLEDADKVDRRLRFHIEATMKMDPAPEEITFDTVLEIASGEYKVK